MPWKRQRQQAFKDQKAKCYYCNSRMWLQSPAELTARTQLSKGQVKQLQCTAEHLTARKDGGSNAQSNIVAACHYCNQKRHQRKKDLTPQQFQAYVNKRLEQGRWQSWRV